MFNIVLDTQAHYRDESEQTSATSKASQLCTRQRAHTLKGVTDFLHICDGNVAKFTVLCQDNYNVCTKPPFLFILCTKIAATTVLFQPQFTPEHPYPSFKACN